MLISESHRFLFVHVQKTAGTSVTRFLEPYARKSEGTRLNKLASDMGLVRDWRRHHFRIHSPLKRAEKILPPEVFGSLFKFAFVRNPWDRLVSWYVYVLRDTTHRRHRQAREEACFERFGKEKPLHDLLALRDFYLTGVSQGCLQDIPLLIQDHDAAAGSTDSVQA